MKRIFVYDKREFPDPDPSMTVEEVKDHMASLAFPELVTATIKDLGERPAKQVSTLVAQSTPDENKTEPVPVAEEPALTPGQEALVELAVAQGGSQEALRPAENVPEMEHLWEFEKKVGTKGEDNPLIAVTLWFRDGAALRQVFETPVPQGKTMGAFGTFIGQLGGPLNLKLETLKYAVIE